jgi:hypothetical protein
MHSSASWASYSFRLGEIDVVGGDQRRVVLIGPVDQARLGGRLARQAVALQLDIEAVAEHPLHLGQGRLASAVLPAANRASTGPSVPPDSRIRPSAYSTTLAQGTTGSGISPLSR